ncbi:MAG: hypothetical protein UT05_C0022G0001 [Parcubacteria group bacterium GW2011_GWF2_38_76]|nr:MAG: hypothetical protein UT05_C0022G0001 [Parcubacteria group bacterium GW2011_GWF2_38_76]
MDKEERKKYEEAIEKNTMESIKNTEYPLYRRSHWDEWGSPVGLMLAWAPGLVCIGIFLWLLHLAGLIG